MSITKTTTSWAKALALALIAVFAAMIALAVAPPAYADEGGNTPIVVGAKAQDDAGEYGTPTKQGAFNNQLVWKYYTNNFGNTLVITTAEGVTAVSSWPKPNTHTDKIHEKLIDDDGNAQLFEELVFDFNGLEVPTPKAAANNIGFLNTNDVGTYLSGVKKMVLNAAKFNNGFPNFCDNVESVIVGGGFTSESFMSNLSPTSPMFNASWKTTLKSITFPEGVRTVPAGQLDLYTSLEWIRFQASELENTNVGQTSQSHIYNGNATVYYPQSATGYDMGYDADSNMLPFKEDAVLVAVPDIDGLPAAADVTANDERKIASVRAAWNVLTDQQAALVSTWADYQKLIDAEAALEAAKVTKVDKPQAAEGLVYTGEELTGVAAAEGYTVDGGTATNAGSYAAMATLSEGYVWADGSYEPVEIPWSIAKATVTTPLAKTGLVYNGKSQTGVAAGAGYVLKGNSGTNAGSYTATLTADANHVFEGGKATASVKWSIAKANGAVAFKVKKKTLKIKVGKSLKANKAFKVTKNSSKGRVTYKKAKGNKKILVAKNGKITVKKGLKAGTYKIKVKITSAATANYNAATSKVVTFKVKVQ